MKKTAALTLLLLMVFPGAAAAQLTSDDIINQIIKDLQNKNPIKQQTFQFTQFTPSSSSAAVASTTAVVNPFVSVAPSAPATAVAQTAPAQAQPTTTAPVAPAPPAEMEQLKSLLAVLTAQVRALIAQTTPKPAPVATTTAATTLAVDSGDAETDGSGDATFVFERDLKLGSRGDDVGMLQQILIAKNFFYGDVTGYFGSLTRTALRAFQGEYGLPVVGTVGPMTRAVLNDIAKQPNFGAKFETPELFTSGSMSFPINASTSDPFSTSTMPFASSTVITGASSSGPVAVSLSLLPARVAPGGAVSLTWLTQNASVCEGSDGWSGPKPTLGAAKVEPVVFSLNFVLTCTGPLGTASTSAMVIVE